MSDRVSELQQAEDSRGYFGIGVVGAKTPANVGTLWRSAHALGAQFIFTAGHRYPKQPSDTMKTWRHVPLIEYADGDDLLAHVPRDCSLIAVELDPRARPLSLFTHPERAIYVLGAEDRGVPRSVLAEADSIVQIPGTDCLNVAVAGSIVLYDRVAKLHRATRRPLASALPVEAYA